MVLLATGKKASFRNGIANANGETSEMVSGGNTLRVLLGADALGGTLSVGGVPYTIDGARSVFSAKDAESKAVAAQLLAKWRNRPYAIVAISDGGKMDCLTVTVAAKGKVKVSGTTGNGAKISASAQLIVGADGRCMIPVVVAKKAKMSFGVWLEDGVATVTGIDNAVAGPTGKTIGATVDFGDLPAGYSRFPDAKTEALKLKLMAKNGAVKGSFKLSAVVNGRAKKVSVSVVGVQIGDVAYCVATVKRVASWTMTVTP